MARQQTVLVDTNVLFGYYKGNHDAQHLLRTIGYRNVGISVITEAEFLFRAFQRERNARELLLSRFRVFSIDSEASAHFRKLICNYERFNQMGIGDALIAATALANSLPLCTYNRRDFENVEGLELYPI